MGFWFRNVPDLAAIRNNRGLTLEKIAESTKIRTYYLQAIERGNLQRLPGGVYTRSYIRQYARAIDYDEADLLGRFNLPGEESSPSGLVSQPAAMLERLMHFLNGILHFHGAEDRGRRAG